MTIYGLMAQFEDEDALIRAVQATRDAGYTAFDAFTPYPVEEVDDLMPSTGLTLTPFLIVGGVVGVMAGFALQYYLSAVAYPLNVGGRPLASWTAFVPVSVELGISLAALSIILGMFLLNRLPQPYHQVFNVAAFARASQDAFFLCIEAEDELFDERSTREFLESTKPVEVFRVDP